MTTSPVVEKAFYQAHEVSYSEYENSMELKTKIESQREKEHRRALQIVYEFTRKKG
jgi:hypothetical protein